MTNTELLSLFQSATMHRCPDYLAGTDKRARWIVADAMREQAKTEEKAMAARLRNAAGLIEAGNKASKDVHAKIGNVRWGKIKAIYLKNCRKILASGKSKTG